MRRTLLKRYITKHSISVSEIAQQCNISEGYASKIVNNQVGVIKMETLAALADYLSLPLPELNRLRCTLCAESSRTLSSITMEGAKIVFLEYLENVLDGIDEYDRAKVKFYHEKIVELKDNSVDFYPNYIQGYDGWRFALEDEFQRSMECFKAAQSFNAKSEVEMRLKSKILSGLGEALLAKGYYRDAMKALRQSLMMWNDGRKQTGWIYLQIGALFKRKGDLPRALAAYRKAQAIGDENIRALALSTQILFEVHSDKQVSRESIASVFHKVKDNKEAGLKGGICGNLGEVFLELEDFYTAEWLFKKAIRFSLLEENLRNKHRAMIGLGNTYLAKNDQASFGKMVHCLESEISEEADSVNVCRKLNLLSWYHIKNKQFSSAKRILQESYYMAQQARLPFEMVSSCRELRKCHRALHEPALADFYGGEEARIKRLIRIK